MSQGKPLARVQAEADSARVKWISQTSASRVVRSKADRQLSAKIAHSASHPGGRSQCSIQCLKADISQRYVAV